jgi:hypothetical protein
MKKFTLLAILIANISTVVAQSTIYSGDGTLSSNRVVTLNGKNLNFKSTSGSLFVNGSNGFTGINNVSPTTALDVNGDLKSVTATFTKSPANGQTFASYAALTLASLVINAGSLPTTGSHQRTFSFQDFPQSNFNTTPTVWFDINNRNDYTRLRFTAAQDGPSTFYLFDKTQVANFVVEDNGSNRISLYMGKPDSRVCIGTTSSTDGTDVYSLSVNGNVRADRVKVYTTWADYVFEKGYKLPTLEEVEKHIKDKGHLQDIPSAAEVESKGIDLGNMNRLLLQKIEELTLYMIEQNKVTAQQTKQIEELKAKVQTLSEKN